MSWYLHNIAQWFLNKFSFFVWDSKWCSFIWHSRPPKFAPIYFSGPVSCSHPHGLSLDKQVYCWLTDMPSVFPSSCLDSHHPLSWYSRALLLICPNSTLFSRSIHSSAIMFTPPCYRIRITWPNRRRPGFGPKWICLFSTLPNQVASPLWASHSSSMQLYEQKLSFKIVLSIKNNLCTIIQWGFR